MASLPSSPTASGGWATKRRRFPPSQAKGWQSLCAAHGGRPRPSRQAKGPVARATVLSRWLVRSDAQRVLSTVAGLVPSLLGMAATATRIGFPARNDQMSLEKARHARPVRNAAKPSETAVQIPMQIDNGPHPASTRKRPEIGPRTERDPPSLFHQLPRIPVMASPPPAFIYQELHPTRHAP